MKKFQIILVNLLAVLSLLIYHLLDGNSVWIALLIANVAFSFADYPSYNWSIDKDVKWCNDMIPDNNLYEPYRVIQYVLGIGLAVQLYLFFGWYSVLAFAVFDYFGYNISSEKGWVNEKFINPYRITQFIVQIGITIGSYFLGGWVIANDTATATTTSNSIYKTIGTTLNNTYKVTFKATVTSGTVQAIVGGYAGGTVINTTGSYTQYITATNASSNMELYFVGNNFTGKVTNITCQKITQPSLTLRIGNQTKTITGISCVPATFTKFVFNFQSNSLVSNQDIKLWINQADTVYVDDVSLTKAYDLSATFWTKTSASSGAFYAYSQYGTTGDNGYCTYINTNKLRFLGATGTVSEISNTGNSNKNINSNTWLMANDILNRGNHDTLYVQINDTVNNKTALLIGRQVTTTNLGFYIGAFRDASGKLAGQIGQLRITKFTDISQSNVNSTTLTTAYNRGKLIQNEWTGGSPVEVAFYDWKGATASEMLQDKSGTGNNLTGTNIDLNDRVKVKGKFK